MWCTEKGAVLNYGKRAMRNKCMDKQNVYIVGAKNCGTYGGFETFLDKLTEYHRNNDKIMYHIAWKGDKKKEFKYHNAHCFQINVPNIGAAQAIYYDVAALKYCIRHIEKNNIVNPVIYVLACRIGPFVTYFKKKLHRYNGRLYVNPDGHEWMREKWSIPVRKYWKISERLMVKYADLLICDNKNIEKYIQDTYVKYVPQTTYIAYGADLALSTIMDEDSKITAWNRENGVKKNGYYLIVGRFVPENNYETIIKEFMRSQSSKYLVIITTVNKKFLIYLEQKLHIEADPRIKFVGTVYDQELLKKIRENAYGYLHGHEVGGTNPSLLESLAHTDINLALNVSFNTEVCGEGALYWSKESGDLACLLERADAMLPEEVEMLGEKAKKQIADHYTWEQIAKKYEYVFTEKTD